MELLCMHWYLPDEETREAICQSPLLWGHCCFNRDRTDPEPLQDHFNQPGDDQPVGEDQETKAGSDV